MCFQRIAVFIGEKTGPPPFSMACVCKVPADKWMALAVGRISVTRVALLAAEWAPPRAALAGGRDIDVALAEALAGAQACASLSQKPPVILRGSAAWDTAGSRESPLHKRANRKKNSAFFFTAVATEEYLESNEVQ